LRRRNAELQQRLEEAEGALRAIRSGEVDAFVVVSDGREKILTFDTVDRPYRLMVEQMRQGAALLDAEGVILYANECLSKLAGRPLDALMASPIFSILEPASRYYCQYLLRKCCVGPQQMDLHLLRPDGELLPAYLSLTSLTESDTLIAVVTDLTDQRARKRLEKEVAERTRLASELKQSEARLQLALAAAALGVWTHDLRTDVMTLDTRAQELFGVGSNITRTKVIARIHPEDRGRVDHAVAAVCEGSNAQQTQIFEYRVLDPEGSERWLRVYAHVIFDGARAVSAVGTCEDITERKRWETTQKLLLEELNHRVKNTLATIQAIAGQTLRATKNPSDFVTAFSGRLQSLGIAHSLLIQSSWEGADLTDIARDQLAMRDTDRIVLSGPRVFLTPRLALHMALILHELGTNARKYGALSGSTGGVALSWSVERSGVQMLDMEWQEREGPPVTAPTSAGFGMRLIERSIKPLGGETRVEFAPAGFACRIRLPLDPKLSPDRR
jgi:PAS domain S-box-containing protein